MSDVGGFDYFLTATCNDARTFGVRRVREAVHDIYGHDGAEVQRVLQSYCAIMCRCWERTMRYIMHWLEHSPQQPCGQVLSTWFRYEFQSHGAPGNKPHVHGFVKVAGEEDSEKVERIRCKMSSMFAPDAGTDRQTLLASGLITDQCDFGDLMMLCEMLCVHDCAKANSRCQKVLKDGSTMCRVQQHPPSLEYTFKGNPEMYNTELVGILHQLGLTDMNHAGRPQAVRQLIGGRWQYPADRHETFIPTIPILFVVLQSCTNVQYIDRRFQVSYVCKYAAGVQEHREVTLSRPKAGDTVSVQDQDQQNINSTGQGTASSLKPSTSLAWEIGQAEMTCQVVVIHQYIDNVYYLDTTWRFSLRPPELMLFDTLQMYCKWFIRGQRCQQCEASPALAQCVWIDGTGHRVYLRQRYIAEAADHMRQLSFMDNDDVSEPAMELYRDVFGPLEQAAEHNQHTPLYLRFVDTTATQHNVVVYSAVTPFQFPRFLIHLLLSKGHFQTEIDLYPCRDLPEAFVQTGLLPSVHPSEEEVATLIRSYVTQQLQWLPIGNRTFQAIVLMLPAAFQAFLFEDTYVFESMPLATDIAISAAASDTLQRLEMDRHHSAVAALSQYHFPDFPDVADLRNGVPTFYNLPLHRAPAQTDASFAEQGSALHALRTALDTLHQPGHTFVWFPLLVGPPGCGKTHLLMMAQVYAILAKCTKVLFILSCSSRDEISFKAGGIETATVASLDSRSRSDQVLFIFGVSRDT